MNMITSNANSIDRISNLPDTLLCHILSFLTTKEAAATSILSKQWRCLWNLVPEIDINDSQIRRNGRYKLKTVVWNCLLTKETIVRKIRLQSNSKINHKFLETFLSIRPPSFCTVEELDLYVRNCYDDEQVSFTLPRGIFSCKTLVILKLTRQVIVDVDSSVQLPSLKVLHLSYVRYKGDESVRNLISGCPVLVELLAERDKRDSVIRYDITSPTLTNASVDCRDLYFGSFTTLNAPGLKYLTIMVPLLINFEVRNVGNLVEANIHVDYDGASIWDGIIDNIRAINNVKFLQLKGGVLKAQRESYDHKYIASIEKLPVFHNLINLKLSDVSCVWCLFKRLMPKFPHLKHLTISRVHMCYKRLCGMPYFPIPSESIPACLSLHLTTFKLQKFEGFELEMCFIRCVLKKSKALMDMTINYPPGFDSRKRFHIWKKLSSFERGSTKCQLSFVEG